MSCVKELDDLCHKCLVCEDETRHSVTFISICYLPDGDTPLALESNIQVEIIWLASMSTITMVPKVISYDMNITIDKHGIRIREEGEERSQIAKQRWKMGEKDTVERAYICSAGPLCLQTFIANGPLDR